MEFIVNAWNALVQAISNALTSFGGVMRQFTYKDAIDILIVACEITQIALVSALLGCPPA